MVYPYFVRSKEPVVFGGSIDKYRLALDRGANHLPEVRRIFEDADGIHVVFEIGHHARQGLHGLNADVAKEKEALERFRTMGLNNEDGAVAIFPSESALAAAVSAMQVPAIGGGYRR